MEYPWNDGDRLDASELNKLVKFGGDGSDGVLAISSGTTDIDLGAEQIVIKNYISMSITGTGKLTFSNPHTNGTIIILKSQGDVTLTSSQTPMIDATGMGAGLVLPTGLIDTVNDDPRATVGQTSAWGGGGTGGRAVPYAVGVTGGSQIVNVVTLYTDTEYKLASYQRNLVCGTGGGNGGDGCGPDSLSNGGVGGKGGPVLIIECHGAWNFTTTGGISVDGADGGDATAGDPRDGGGGGAGGGAGGSFLGLYNVLTANTGSVTYSGGDGGDGGDGAMNPSGSDAISAGLGAGDGGTGGSGGGSLAGVGGNGGTTQGLTGLSTTPWTAGTGGNAGSAGAGTYGGVAGASSLGGATSTSTNTYRGAGSGGGTGGGGGAEGFSLIAENKYFA